MSDKSTCEECGAKLPANAPQGLCPRCLADMGMRLAIDMEKQTIAIGGILVPVREKSGERIGRYKLLQKIGEGGMGVVYMAEQEEPVRRRIALKIIKLGMDTRQVVARFEAERQALALMDHPNIAKVLDAGSTEAGRPYFVMELVRGVAITEYCDKNHSALGQRLDLFIQVCHAIQHAHQKGIIHRDLKPSNILVTLNDGVPLPMVIDFGVARATDQKLTEKTLFTNYATMIGTPAYMSPEQAEMSKLDIDTRADIYSLGVLLYELLTGTTPFPAKELFSMGYGEMQRVIAEQEPLRPSTCLSTMANKERIVVGKNRSMEASALGKLFRGDLDWIVMKCLEKDRARRYDTANGLSQDVKRYLNTEPVVARPPSSLYRFQKMVRRNKLVFAASGAVVGALVVGLVASTWLFIKARTAEQDQARLRQQAETNETKAKNEAVKSQQVSQLFKDMLTGVGPIAAAGRDTGMLREIVDNAAARIGNGLKDQPAIEAEMLTSIGLIYLELDEAERAEAVLRRVLTVRRKLPADEHPMARSGATPSYYGALHTSWMGDERPNVAASLYNLGMALFSQGKVAEAKPMFEEALATNRQLTGDESPEVAACLDVLSVLMSEEGKSDEAENIARGVLAIRKKRLGDEHPDIASSLVVIGRILERKDDWPQAEKMYREALAIWKNEFGAEHLQVALTLESLGNVLVRERKLAAAELTIREALRILEKVLGQTHYGSANLSGQLATVLRDEGKAAEAEAFFGKQEVLLHQQLAIAIKSYGDSYAKLYWPVTRMNDFLRFHGRYQAEGEQVLNNVLSPALITQALAAPWISARGNLRARAGRWSEAAADFSKMIELNPEDHWNYFVLAPLLVQSQDLDTYHRLCSQIRTRFEGTTNDPTVAERMAKACLLLSSPGAELTMETRLAELAVTAGQNHRFIAYFQFCKGLVEYRQRRFAGAAEWMQKVLGAVESNSFAHEVAAYMVLAMACHELKQVDEARAALVKGVEIAQTKLPKLESGDFGESWAEWVIAHILMHEAKALIDSQSSTTNEPPKQKE